MIDTQLLPPRQSAHHKEAATELFSPNFGHQATPTEDIAPQQPPQYRAWEFDPTNPCDNLGFDEQRILRDTMNNLFGRKSHRGEDLGLEGVNLIAYTTMREVNVDTSAAPSEDSATIAVDPYHIAAAASTKGSAIATELKARAATRGLTDSMNSRYRTKGKLLSGVADAAEKPYRALVNARPKLKEYGDGINEQATSFRLLPHGRIAHIDNGNGTTVYVYNNGQCDKLPTNSQGIHVLDPGRNIILLASDDAEHVSTQERTDKIRDIITQNDLDTNDSQLSVYGIARDALNSRDESLPAGVAMAAIVDIKPWADRRSRLRRASDYIRPSTLAYAALSMHTRLGIRRREIYEEATTRGRVMRRIARASDAIGGVAALGLAYHFGRAFLVSKGIIASSGNQAFALDVTTNAHIPNAESVSALPHNIEPVDIDPKTTPAPTDQFPHERTALARDPAINGKASCVWRWSERALADVATAENLSKAQIKELLDSDKIVEKINQGFYDDNPKVGKDPDHVVDDGKRYNVNGQYDTAKQIVQDYKESHGLAPSTPVTPPVSPAEVQPEVIPSPPPLPEPTHLEPPKEQQNDWFKIPNVESLGQVIGVGQHDFWLRTGALTTAAMVGMAWTWQARKQHRTSKTSSKTKNKQPTRKHRLEDDPMPSRQTATSRA